jgi:hypothetical protein
MGTRRMNESADELRNLALALLANAKALQTAGKAARVRGLLLKDMARTARNAAARSRKQAEILRRRQDTR